MKFRNSKIYKIVSSHTDKIYIGSTTTSLSQRLAIHRDHMKRGRNTSSKEILQHPDAKIVLIERYPCKSNEELHQREEYHRRQNIEICVNKNRAFQTPEEKKEQKNFHNKKRIICDYCGCNILYNNIYRHRDAKSHIANIKYANMVYNSVEL